MSKGYVAAWPKGREASKHPALIKSLKTGVAGGGGRKKINPSEIGTGQDVLRGGSLARVRLPWKLNVPATSSAISLSSGSAASTSTAPARRDRSSGTTGGRGGSGITLDGPCE